MFNVMFSMEGDLKVDIGNYVIVGMLWDCVLVSGYTVDYLGYGVVGSG